MIGTMSKTVLIALHKIGPYHHSRLVSAALHTGFKLVVLETRPNSTEYSWDFNTGSAPYSVVKLEGAQTSEIDPPPNILKRQLHFIINTYRPVNIVIVGWADPAYLTLLALSYIYSIPCTVISDSRSSDSSRNFILESIKKFLLKGVSSALVAGTESRQYIESLGLPSAAIFQPWDVVDNSYFQNATLASSSRDLSHLSSPFICVGRFIPEKNHAFLLDVYHRYQAQGGNRQLLLVGDGPLYNHLVQKCNQLPDCSKVIFYPFTQLQDLTAIYKSSHALILCSIKDTWGLVVNEAIASGIPVIVSSACGCSTDLLEHTLSGYVFSPTNSAELLNCINIVDTQTLSDRTRVVSEAKKKLSSFALSNFSTALQQAIVYASQHTRYSRLSLFFSRILSLLSRS